MDINVMMIGFAGAGKTSYMGGLYNRLNNGNVEGFSIKATDEDDHKAFTRIGETLRRGKYPLQTDIMSDYNFNLRYHYNDILNFNWNDYRGGVLAESSSETSSVVSNIVSSDALIIFLDATKFLPDHNMLVDRFGRQAENKHRNDRTMIAILRRVSLLIQQTISRVGNDILFPISIVLTKIDKIGELSELFESNAFKVISEDLIPNISKNNNIHGLLTVTAVGTRSLNIEYPFLFSMRYCLLKKFKQILHEYEDGVSTYDFYVSKSGILDDIGSFISDVPTYRKMANDKADEVNSLVRIAQDISEPLDSVGKIILHASQSEENLLWCF